MEDKNHVWGEADTDGVRRCLNRGCHVRRTDTHWQRAKGGHWRSLGREEYPFCLTRKAKA
jgi:hypothetical protein